MPYKQWPYYDVPDRDASIWRYMVLDRFVSLLDNGALYLATAEKFDDSFEGSVTQLTIEARYRDRPDQVKLLAERNQQMRKWCPINCWHVNEHESEGMWRLYLRSGDGIVIRSSFGRLCGSLAGFEHDVKLGLVRYLDYATQRIFEGADRLMPLFSKRRAYEHERELRAIVDPFDPERAFPMGEVLKDRGMFVPVDLRTLIEHIHVAPMGRASLIPDVRSIVKRYGLDEGLVVESDLRRNPIW
jgi:hypothetical protein